jgi:haloalkane dehalogenase
MIINLTKRGYRVIAPDMLGFGNSDSPKGYDVYTPKEHAKRILALMDSLQIKKWTHVTHDACGLSIWKLLSKACERVSHLALLNTIIYKKGFKPPIKMMLGSFTKFNMWLYKNKTTSSILLDQLLKKGLKGNNLSDSETEGYRTPLKEGKNKAMYHFFSNACNRFPNYSSVLKNCNIPTMVVWENTTQCYNGLLKQKR